MNDDPTLIRIGAYKVHPARRVVQIDGETLALTSKAFEVLMVLIENRDRVVSRTELMGRIWPDVVVEEANLTQHISTLRKVFGERAGENQFIVTVPGQGYRFVAPVEVVGDTTALSRVEPSDATVIEGQFVGVIDWKKRARWMIGVALLFLFAALLFPGLIRHVVFPPAEPGPPSVAVLPFDAYEVGPPDFGVSVADALISRLGGSANFTVRPTGDILEFSDPGDDTPAEAGEQLGVTYVVAGRLRHQEEEIIHASVQMILTADHTVVWSARFDLADATILDLQSGLADQVASRMDSYFETRGRH